MVPLHTPIGMNPEVRYPKWLESHPLTPEGVEYEWLGSPATHHSSGLASVSAHSIGHLFRDGMSSMQRHPPVVYPHKTARNIKGFSLFCVGI